MGNKLYIYPFFSFLTFLLKFNSINISFVLIWFIDIIKRLLCSLLSFLFCTIWWSWWLELEKIENRKMKGKKKSLGENQMTVGDRKIGWLYKNTIKTNTWKWKINREKGKQYFLSRINFFSAPYESITLIWSAYAYILDTCVDRKDGRYRMTMARVQALHKSINNFFFFVFVIELGFSINVNTYSIFRCRQTINGVSTRPNFIYGAQYLICIVWFFAFDCCQTNTIVAKEI